jgi:glyoxylase-like metal-dependent hydrolase (beta-lactamase superfamily II)
MTHTLTYETLVVDGVSRAAGSLPTGERFVTSPLALTLIMGEQDAVLVDAPYSYGQIERTRAWIEATGKRLTAVYVTHAHGDHWLGAEELLQSFPAATLYATSTTAARMKVEAVEGRAQMWDRVLPDLIPPCSLLPEIVPAEGLLLEGHQLVPVELGHTDTDDTTGLWVPSLRLFVAGDAVYNGAHLMLMETGDGGFDAWLAAIDKIEALNPRFIVAGHKAPGAPDDAGAAIRDTRKYLNDARRTLSTSSSAREFYDTMLALHPQRMNPSPLWYGALALIPEAA